MISEGASPYSQSIRLNADLAPMDAPAKVVDMRAILLRPGQSLADLPAILAKSGWKGDPARGLDAMYMDDTNPSTDWMKPFQG